MLNNYAFSKHANRRIGNRTKMNSSDICRMLSREQFVTLHRELSVTGHTDHLLYYSKPDQKFYIAVVAIPMREVVTILLSGYHRKCYKAITSDQLHKAKELAVNWHPAVIKSLVFIVKAHYIGSAGHKVTGIMKCESVDYGDDIDTYATDSTVQFNITTAMDALMVKEGLEVCDIVAVSVRIGHNGSPKMYKWDGRHLIAER